MEYINAGITITIIIAIFGIAALLWLFIQKKYLPTVEFKLTRFSQKVLKTDTDIDLLIDKEVVASLEYNRTRRELWLNVKNNRKLLISPKYDSEPEKLIQYLVDNPNRKVTRTELIEKADLSPRSSLSKLASDLRFTGNLRDLFINVSKSSVFLTNPITQKHLKSSKFTIDKILD